MANLATTLLVALNFVHAVCLSWVGHWAPWGHRSIDLWPHWHAGRGPFASSHPPNLIYIKIPKAASSTTGGVARRIAARHGLGCVHDGLCDWSREPSVSAHHRERRYLESLGLQRPIVWMTSIRDPLNRCMSMFYHFEVGLNGVADSAENKIAYLKSQDCRNYQWNFMCPPSICKTNNTKKAFEAYNFILLVERFDESMALLIRTLGLSMSDALYLEAKRSSTFSVPHVDFSDEPAEVQAFGDSEEFKAQNELDYKLWHMVNDRITVQMQEERNKEMYAAFLRLLRNATSSCSTNCTWNVDKNLAEDCADCYWNDNGCGYTCFDRLSATR